MTRSRLFPDMGDGWTQRPTNQEPNIADKRIRLRLHGSWIAFQPRIEDAGIAARHSRGYFSTLQGPERDWEGWTSLTGSQNWRKNANFKKSYDFATKLLSFNQYSKNRGLHFQTSEKISDFCRRLSAEAILIVFVHCLPKAMKTFPQPCEVRVLAPSGALYYIRQ